MKEIYTMNIDDYVNNSASSINGPNAVAAESKWNDFVCHKIAFLFLNDIADPTATTNISNLSTSISSAMTTTGIVGAQKAIEKYLKLVNAVNDVNASIELVKEILNHPHIYVFGEFIANEKFTCFAEENEEFKKWFQMLNLFAYGKYLDYSETVHPAITGKWQQLNQINNYGWSNTDFLHFVCRNDEKQIKALDDC